MYMYFTVYHMPCIYTCIYPISAHLQEEVEEDGDTSVEGEAPDGRHGGHTSKEEGSRLRERGEQETGSDFTNGTTNELPDAHFGEIAVVVLDKLTCLSLKMRTENTPYQYSTLQ